MAYIDELISRLERQEAANSQHRHGIHNESVTCPNCGAEIDLDDNSGDNDDDSDKWQTEDGETSDDGGQEYEDRLNKMNKQNQLTPEQKLARALVESAARNSNQPQQVNRPSQLAKPAQRAQASNQPHAQENAALVLARAIAELRGEKR